MAKRLQSNGQTLIVTPNGKVRRRLPDAWPSHAVYTTWPEVVTTTLGHAVWICGFTLKSGDTWYYFYGNLFSNTDAAIVQSSWYNSPIGQVPPPAVGEKFNFWLRGLCFQKLNLSDALDWIDTH